MLKKTILFFSFFSFLALLLAPQTNAQNAPTNSFQCYWDTAEVIDRCKLQINCSLGNFPAQGSYCVGLPQSQCESQPAYTCTATNCGGANQPCCSTGSACGTGLGCVNPGSICSPNACGLAEGSPCCAANTRCVGPNLDCDIRTQLCRTKNCGGPNQACCTWRINPCDDPNNYYCSNQNNPALGVCAKRDPNACGDYNEPCCPGRTCPGSSALSCDPQGYCKSPTGCGANRGANCCPGEICFRGLSCAFNQCFAAQCGKIGKACCPETDVIGGCWEGSCSAGQCIDDPNQGTTGTTVVFPGGCSTTNSQQPVNGIGGDGIQTAIGCIPLGGATLIVIFFLKWGTLIAGGIALLMFLYSGFLIMTSQGDPARLQSGKELIISALTGVLLIIFSIFVLRLLGVSILGLF